MSQFIAIFVTHQYILLVSIAELIENKITQMPEGEVFFISDFADIGNDVAVRQTLQRLTRKSIVIRLSQGIYYFPVHSNLLGIVYPSAEKIALAISKRDEARLIPTGSYALYKLGLSTQVPMNVVFLTDGSARKMVVGNQKITFKKTSPRNLAVSNKLTNLIVQSLKELGEKNVEANILQRLKEVITQSGEAEEIKRNMKYAPVWIRNKVLQLMTEI